MPGFGAEIIIFIHFHYCHWLRLNETLYICALFVQSLSSTCPVVVQSRLYNYWTTSDDIMDKKRTKKGMGAYRI